MGKETILSFNGSGTFVRLYNWVNDAAANIKIRADRMDAEMNGMATGLSTCITKDGQTTVTANLPMATYRHTGVGAAVNRTDYARAGEVQDGSFNWVDGGGTADAITASYSIPLTALVDGQLCFVRATAANATTTPTFSPSGLTARTIVKNGNHALAAGDIAGDGHELILRYRLSDTKWELLNPAVTGVPTLTGNNTLSGNNTFTGKILTPDDGELTISSGAVTVTGVYHTVDTESDAATDNLDTINGGSDGQILILQTENSSRDVILTTSGNIVSPNGNITLASTSDSVTLIYSGALSKWVIQSASVVDPFISSMTNRVLNGLKMSNGTDATNDIDIAAGSCVSDDGTTVMTLSAITKQLDAAWAVGTNQGGLDTGTIANTTYHVWVINRPDTNVTDVLFSTSASSPTMPSNYTKKKCIGSIVRVSGAILAFTQLGRKFILTDGPLDVSVTNLGTSATDYTISAPGGVQTIARVRIFYEVPSSSGAYGVRVYSKSESDEAISQTTKALPNVQNYQAGSSASTWSMSSELEILTNTSSQIRAVSTVASTTLRIVTVGWEDFRI